jgi:hypothetical protein
MAVIILAFPLGHMSSVHRPLIRAFDNLPSARVTAPELHELLNCSSILLVKVCKHSKHRK